MQEGVSYQGETNERLEGSVPPLQYPSKGKGNDEYGNTREMKYDDEI